MSLLGELPGLVLVVKAAFKEAEHPRGVDGKWTSGEGGQTSYEHHPDSGPHQRQGKDRHAKGGQGMNWVLKPKRLAIYERDGKACAWCGVKAEDGNQLTLDHLTPHAHGGSNHESNLVTSCLTCNSHRKDAKVND